MSASPVFLGHDHVGCCVFSQCLGFFFLGSGEIECAPGSWLYKELWNLWNWVVWSIALKVTESHLGEGRAQALSCSNFFPRRLHTREGDWLKVLTGRLPIMWKRLPIMWKRRLSLLPPHIIPPTPGSFSVSWAIQYSVTSGFLLCILFTSSLS